MSAVIVTPLLSGGPGVWRRSGDAGEIMSSGEALETVNSALAHARGQVSFVFSGPEPLLAGKEFFSSFLALEKEFLRPGQEVQNTVCTSGESMDEAWADFFAQAGIRVTLVLDGMWDQPLGDGKFPTWDQSWKTADRAVSLLRSRELEAHAIFRVTAYAARRAQGIYGKLKRARFDSCLFTPYTAPDKTLQNETPWALSPSQYEHFLKTLFDLWQEDRQNGLSPDIRPFEDYVAVLAGMRPGAVLSGAEELRLCASCRWAGLCAGRKVKYPSLKDGDYFCGTYRWFFEYAEKRLIKLAEQEKMRRFG